MKWLEISIITTAQHIEAMAEVLNELGTGGVVIEDPAVLYELVDNGALDEVAIKREDISPLGPVVKGYLSLGDRPRSQIEAELEDRIKELGPGLCQGISYFEIDDADWSQQWKKYYHPFSLGKRLLVKPTWEKYEDHGDRLVLNMDPGMAFGCGTHPTTGLCLELLEEAVRGGELVYDVGTGSGILAVAAAKLGAGQVLALDLDEVAVKTAKQNVDINGVGHIVTVQRGNLLEAVGRPAHLVVANIVADIIIALIPEVPALLLPGGGFICSGIIEGRQDDVHEQLHQYGFDIKEIRHRGDWYAMYATPSVEKEAI